jgi:serine/threonine protein kinase
MAHFKPSPANPTDEPPMNWLREPGAEPIPGYRLIEPLGNGGFGEVWKCEAPGGILKAIKIVFGNLDAPDGDSAKAEQEAAALERVKLIRHPFIISMDLIKVIAGELLIVMELADKSLHDLFEEYRKAGRPGIPREQLLGFLGDAANGLDHLIEKHNLQHLDIKPKNLFLIADRVKVADFGLVRTLERQSAIGMMGGISPVYAAPESFSNKVSKHSDQYSLAIVYAELISGVKPFNGKNIRQLAMQHMMEAPNLGGVPECDVAAVAKALSKNPDDRFPSCQAFIKALMGNPNDAHTITMPSKPTPVSSGSTAKKPSNRNPEHQPTPPPATKKAAMRFPAAPVADDGSTRAIPLEADAGVLRPAIFIGVGSFGRRALQQVRCRLLDRVGQLNHVPCLRFVYVDPDPNAAEKAASAAPDIALHSEHLFLTPLQPVTNYRRRQLDQLLEWLPREKLHSIPRSLKIDGSRALGRLAFCDHYLRFMTRMRHEVTVSTHPEALQQSSNNTGLPIRTKTPAVYVFVSASGGTSGMLMDLGYAVRRSLEKMNVTDATITCFVLAGAPEDTNSPPEELANIFASLTELNHYADPDVAFTAQYGGPEGPITEGRGLPFTATYLLPMAERSGDALRDCISHLAGYVTYDLTTPLGGGLEAIRHMPPPMGRTPFRGFGTFGVWYPRGLLLRSAARQICIDTVRNWATKVPALPPAAEAVLQGILADTRLTPEPVKQFIVQESATRNEGDPLQRLRTWEKEVGQQLDDPGIRHDPISWAVATWDQARDWVGMEPTTESDSGFRRGRLSKALDHGLRRAAEAWDHELTAKINSLEKVPGPRIGYAELVVESLLETAAGATEAMELQQEALAVKRENAKVACQAALEQCQAGGKGFSLFGNRTLRALRHLVDRIREFIDLRVQEDLTSFAVQFYRRIHNRFDEHLQDLKATRERLGQLSELMEVPIVLGSPSHFNTTAKDVDGSAQTTLQGSNTMRIVLPHGEDQLDRSAAELLEAVPRQSLIGLEEVLTKVVVESRGGLVHLATCGADLIQQLANPLIDQATSYLSNLMPTQDVTAVEYSAAKQDLDELSRRVGSYIRGAAPLTGGPAEEEKTFLVYPDTEPGRLYAEAVRRVVPAVHAVPVEGFGTDLMFCREQGGLRTADLFRLIDPCWDAYHQQSATMLNNAHSRFDVTEWLPLVE